MTGWLLETGWSESKHGNVCRETHNIKRDRYQKTKKKRILGRENNNIIICN